MAALRILLLAFAVGCGTAAPERAPEPDDAPAEQPAPAGATYVVEVTAERYHWRVRHAGRDGRLQTADDIMENDAWHLPAGRRVRVRLASKDVPHALWLPAVRFKLDAIPGQTVRGEFATPVPGRYAFRCATVCGPGNARHKAELLVYHEDDFVKWLANGHGR